MFFYVTLVFLIILVILYTVYKKMKDGDYVPVVLEALFALALALIAMLTYCAIITTAVVGMTDTYTKTYPLVPLDGEQGALVRIDMRAEGDRGRVEYVTDGERSRPARLVNIVDSGSASEATVTVNSYAANHPLWWPFGSTSNFEDTYTLTVPADKVIVETDR